MLGGVQYLYTYDSSVAIVTPGFTGLTWEVAAAHESRIEIAGGSHVNVYGSHQSSIVMSGGLILGGAGIFMGGSSSFLMTGGGSDYLTVQDSAFAHITGGGVGEGLRVRESATVLVSGGSIGGFSFAFVAVSDAGVLTWTGGVIGASLTASDGGVVRIVGSDFAVDGVPVGYGVLQGPGGEVTGTLANGTDFAVTAIQDGGTIVLVPEPSTALLLGFGLGVLALRRREPAGWADRSGPRG